MADSHHVLVTSAQLGRMLHAAGHAKGPEDVSQATSANRIGLSQSKVSHLELNARA